MPDPPIGQAIFGRNPWSITLRAPHGGVFVLAIPGAVTNLPMYIVAILAGTLVSTLMLGLLKKPIPQVAAQVEQNAVATD